MIIHCCAGSEAALRCSDFSNETESESDVSAINEDAGSETILPAVCDVQPFPSADLTGSISDAVSGETTNINLAEDDSTHLHSETLHFEDEYSSSFVPSKSDDDCTQSVVNSQISKNLKKYACQADLRILVSGSCEDSNSLKKNGPQGAEDDTILKSRDSDAQESENAAASWSITESESDLSPESDSDSDSEGSCSCGDSTHSCSGDDKSEESDSESSESESESDSSSDGSQETGSGSDSHSSSGENTHGSDCDQRDETDPNDKMTDSDSDWSHSCCCCVCEECCKQESDSDVCCDSESYSSSDEDTTDSDYDGDNEDDDDSMNCQPAPRIASQYSNKTLRLIRVQSVGLVVMAVSKAEEDSVSRRKSVEASSSLQMLKRLGKEVSFNRVPCNC